MATTDATQVPTHAVHTEREARKVIEASRESEWKKPSFGKELFLGRFRLDLIDPMPVQDPDRSAAGLEFRQKLHAYLEGVDGQQIERDAHIPDEVLRSLGGLGAFGMKIDEKYGGLGLTNLDYCRALMLAGSVNPAIGALLSAHQSIGVPQPLKLVGTAEQKEQFLPRLAGGEVSAFLLTEPEVGSYPANLRTSAVPTAEGDYLLNGVKLWATNGTLATLYVVMALVPKSDGHRGGITAFVVEADAPGVAIERRNAFMGLRGLENSVTRFHDVRVPAANVIGGEGQGLRIALSTLNTGRLSLPAMCVGAGKWCLNVAREWAAERVQMGRPIGTYEAIAKKIAFIAGSTYGMEAMLEVSCRLADDGHSDIRIEAALVKLYASELAWKVADELVQIRGGRGYETAESLAARGERPIAAEQILRDLRINRIFEGSTEIMHLAIAREAVDAHLSVAGDIIDPDAALAAKARAAGRARGNTAPAAPPAPPCAGGPAGPAASMPSGCPRWWPARVSGPARSTSSALSRHTCATSSGRRARWPARRSTAWPAGRGSWSTSRASSAGSSTSGRSCSPCPRPASRPGPSRPPGPRAWSWPTCSAGRRRCGPRRCSATCGTTPTASRWRRPSASWPGATCRWRRA